MKFLCELYLLGELSVIIVVSEKWCCYCFGVFGFLGWVMVCWWVSLLVVVLYVGWEVF